MTTLTEKEKRILEALQSGLPLEETPFAPAAEKLGLSESELLNTVQSLKSRGFIRRLGGIFDSRALGMSSTLCAARVPEADCAAFARAVNRYVEVTHNYRRDGLYNIWFTLTARDDKHLNHIIDEIKRETGIDEIIELPVTRCYKIKVELPLS